MIRDTLISILASRLNRSDMSDRIIAELQLIQSTVLEGTGAFSPWFLESEMANVDIVANEERIALPADFLAEVEDQALWLYQPENIYCPLQELHKTDYDRIVLKYQTSGTPKEYALAGDYILLRPVPDASYNIRMRYYAREPDLSTNIENKWLKYASDLVIAEVGAVIAGLHIRNPQLAQEFKDAAMVARDRLYKKHEARKHTNRTYGMGED